MGYLSCFVVLGYYTVVPVVLYVVIIKEWARYMIERASCKPTAIEKDKNTSGATQTSLKSHFTTSIIIIIIYYYNHYLKSSFFQLRC